MTFGATTSIDLGTEALVGHSVGDFNQDGHLDLVVTPSISVLTGDGSGSLLLGPGTAFADASAVAVADFNGDGTLDLAITQALTTKSSADLVCGPLPGVGIFLGPDFLHSPSCLFAGSDPIGVQAADFDGDGRTDLAVVSGSAQGLRIFKAQGDGTFAQVTTSEAGGAVAGSFLDATSLVPPVDLTGDGTLDLVVAHSGGVSTFIGRGDGTFYAADNAGSTGPTAAAAVGDLNEDGVPDIASVESTDGRLLVAFGLGGGGFSTAAIATIGANLADITIADLDHDGHADIIVADTGGGAIRIFFGNGDGTFIANPPLTFGVNPKFLLVRDWDEDGDLDLGIIDAGVGASNAVLRIALQNSVRPLDRTAPSVALTSPAAGSHVRGTVAITATASDNVGVTVVEFYAGASLVGKSAGPNYTVSWNTVTVPNGPVTLAAIPVDAALNGSEWAFVQVTVDNPADTTPPVVTVPGNATVEATGPDRRSSSRTTRQQATWWTAASR